MARFFSGWVAADVARRWRTRFGLIPALEWREFLPRIGLTWEWESLPASSPALLDEVAGVIYVRPGMPASETACIVWHEIGHKALHSGGLGFWGRRYQGRLLVKKAERQAWEFAALFPDWSGFGS